jgi:phage shock protein C
VNPRRLYRSRTDRQLAGVAGGIAEYLEVDPTVVRLLWILSVLVGGFGLVLYVIMAFVVPLEPFAPAGPGPAAAPGPGAPSGSDPADAGTSPAWTTPSGEAATGATRTSAPGWQSGAALDPRGERRPGRGGVFLGVLLVVFGVIALGNVLVPAWIGAGHLWAAFVVALGVALIVGATRRTAADR